MFICPANHTSETPEFCSVCGLEIPGAAAAPATVSIGPAALAQLAAAVVGAGSGGELCPDCGAPREGGGQVFCEVCGYNFASGTPGSGPPPVYVPAADTKLTVVRESADAASTPLEAAEIKAPPKVADTAEFHGPIKDADARWELVVTVDENLYGVPNPDAPVGQPTRIFRIFERETLIGRAGSEVHVQAPISNDAGVSRRHALLIAGPGGSLVLRDLNSINGTQVDGVDVVPGVDTALVDGTAIGVGAWTRITVRAVGQGE